MNEALLQFIWQWKKVNENQLHTLDGKPILILDSGTLNHNEGPDFLMAKVKIEDTVWVGNIEIHVHTSDWYKHQHDNSPLYNNIILHVVYENDTDTLPKGITILPLKQYLQSNTLQQYQLLMQNLHPIPCHNQIRKISALSLSNWFERLLVNRWERKSQEWIPYLQRYKNDWKQMLYLKLAHNFGFNSNSAAFLELAISIPLHILELHRKNLLQLEALLFGQAGWLERNNADQYSNQLEKEYHFLRRKYDLTPINNTLWKFMRMRPVNFPTIRLAQFAMLIHKSHMLFSKFIEMDDYQNILELLDVSASEYWNTHYRLNEDSKHDSIKHLGYDAIMNIYINTVIQMQYWYQTYSGTSLKKNIDLGNLIASMHAIRPEQNKIIQQWKNIGVQCVNSAESQALIELFNEYCLNKRCLECNIGNKILR